MMPGVSGSYVTYAVNSRMTHPKYSSRGASVRRRFRDFVVSDWLISVSYWCYLQGVRVQPVAVVFQLYDAFALFPLPHASVLAQATMTVTRRRHDSSLQYLHKLSIACCGQQAVQLRLTTPITEPRKAKVMCACLDLP